MYFKDPKHSVVEGTPTLVSASATTATHTVSADGDYYFTVITAVDAIGNETTIDCSPTKITVDTVDPTPASGLAWSEGSYRNDTSVTATWTVGGACGASSQELFVYSGALVRIKLGLRLISTTRQQVRKPFLLRVWAIGTSNWSQQIMPLELATQDVPQQLQ